MLKVSPPIWEAQSREAFSNYMAIPRKHLFFIPEGLASRRASIIAPWVRYSELEMHTFWRYHLAIRNQDPITEYYTDRANSPLNSLAK